MHATLEPSLQTDTHATQLPIWRAVLFRFAFVYWLLAIVVIVTNEDVGVTWFGKIVRPVWSPIVMWFAAHVLGISDKLSSAVNGSGDKTFDWVGVLLAAIAGAIATVVWSVLERRRADHARLRALLRVVLRYTLAFALLGYGTSKLFCLQFPSPSALRILQSYGESSPMGLLWTFMGASHPYEFFAGAAEITGALLLLFRRTTALGAAVLAVVLVNVVMMNFCYDVPVKLNAAHYLGMCIYLILPELRRLADVLLFNRATQPVARDAPRWGLRMRIVRSVLKYGLIGWMIFLDLRGALRWMAARDTVTWYGGYWEVTSLSRDGHDVPPLITDGTRWRHLRFLDASNRVYVRWRFMDNAWGKYYAAVIDDRQQTMTFTPDEKDAKEASIGPMTFHYVRSAPDHLTLEGKVGTTELSVQLQKLDVGKSLLMSRGFHWINEEPFSR